MQRVSPQRLILHNLHTYGDVTVHVLCNVFQEHTRDDGSAAESDGRIPHDRVRHCECLPSCKVNGIKFVLAVDLRVFQDVLVRVGADERGYFKDLIVVVDAGSCDHGTEVNAGVVGETFLEDVIVDCITDRASDDPDSKCQSSRSGDQVVGTDYCNNDLIWDDDSSDSQGSETERGVDTVDIIGFGDRHSTSAYID